MDPEKSMKLSVDCFACAIILICGLELKLIVCDSSLVFRSDKVRVNDDPYKQ